MLKRPTFLTPLVLLFLALFGVAEGVARQAGSRQAGLYSPAVQSPFEVVDAPTSLAVADVAGDGFGDLVVGSGGDNRLQLLEMRNGRIDGVRSRLLAASPAAIGVGESRSDEVLVAGGDGLARIFFLSQYYFRHARIVPRESVAVGQDPSAVLRKLVSVYSEGDWLEATAEFLVANRGSDDVSLVDRDWRENLFAGGEGRLVTIGTVPVGDAPLDMAADEGAPGYIFVANSGDGTITQISPFLRHRGGEPMATIPVGGEPVALVVADFVWGDYGDTEIAVVDRALDQVELLDSVRDGGAGSPYEVVGRYSVGDGPVDLLVARLDEQPGVDLAVVNSLSNDISVLLGTGTGFIDGGTYRVGRHPVAIAPIGYGRYFEGDLAIANQGSDDLTILVRNEFGRCQGRVARLRIGTEGADRRGGERGPNETDGRGGDDQLWAGDGDDCIRGQGGDDDLNGNAGDDLIRTGPGEDVVEGQNGKDTIFAKGGGADIIKCGPGEDTAYVDPTDTTRDCEHTR